MSRRPEHVDELAAEALVRSTLARLRDSAAPELARQRLLAALLELDSTNLRDSAEEALAPLRRAEYARRAREAS